MSHNNHKEHAHTDAHKKEERRNSLLTSEQTEFLEKRLANRPDAEALQNAGIIKEGGRFAAAQACLQRELNSDAVARAIDQRPNLEDLIDNNIVEARSVAPMLQAVAKQLERNLIADNLNQKLYSRDDIDELKREGIIKGDNVAPRLREAKIRLEHNLTRDHISHLLEQRPNASELIKQGIIQQPAQLSSRIQSAQKELQHHMTVDRVGHLLEKRSEIDALQQHNILKDVRVAPALQSAQRSLERNLAKSNLYHALKHRPALYELQQRGIYESLPDEESQYDEPSQFHHHESKQTSAAQPSAPQPSYEPSAYQRRSKNFHLTRILLKFVASMAEAGEISLQQKGYLKDLIVDQDKTILAIAEQFDAENDLNDFKDSLIRLASRR